MAVIGFVRNMLLVVDSGFNAAHFSIKGLTFHGRVGRNIQFRGSVIPAGNEPSGCLQTFGDCPRGSNTLLLAEGYCGIPASTSCCGEVIEKPGIVFHDKVCSPAIFRVKT